MCLSCWQERGSPAVDTPAVREAARAVRWLYEFAGAGGGMHIVVDDWNLDDDIAWCLDPLQNLSHHSEDPAERALEIYAGLALLVLSEEERASALALNDGWWR